MMHTAARALILIYAGLLLWPLAVSAGAIQVELRQTGQGWQLLRGVEPYFIRGAGGRMDGVHKHCPAIDIHGINSYGGALTLAERYRAGGANKPYVLTEFGPPGSWEVPKSEWGATFEQTSTEKAAFYRRCYEQGVPGAPGLALGSYVFTWGDQAGGYDLTGATQLELWARGEYGGERINIGVGLIGKDKAHPDSGMTSIDDIVLKHEWQRYRIPLKKLDLSSIKTGFVVTLSGQRTSVNVYLDDIRFVR